MKKCYIIYDFESITIARLLIISVFRSVPFTALVSVFFLGPYLCQICYNMHRDALFSILILIFILIWEKWLDLLALCLACSLQDLQIIFLHVSLKPFATISNKVMVHLSHCISKIDYRF